MSRNAFAGSWAKNFVSSHAHARGSFAAGVKTVHSCLPFKGFGNKLLPGGAITTDPNQKWLYTRKTVTEEWSHSFTYGGQSNTIPQQQQARIAFLLANGWTLVGDGTAANGGWMEAPFGSVGTTHYSLLDLSDAIYSTFPTAPANVAHASAGTQSTKYNSFFEVSGTTLSVPAHVTGTTPTSIGAESSVMSPFDMSGADSHISTPLTYLIETGIPGIPDGSYTHDKTTDLTGVTIDQVTTNGICASGMSAGDTNVSGSYPPPGFALYELFLYGTEVWHYRIATTYSEPVTLVELERRARVLLDATNLTKQSEAYFPFDGGLTVRLDWNLVTNTSIYDIFRAVVTGGTVGSYTRIVRLSAAVKTYTDTTVSTGTVYSYFIRSNIGSNYDSAPVTVTIAPPAGSPVGTQPAAYVSTGSTTTTAPTGFTATLLPVGLTYTKIALALNDATSPNSQIILFATSDTPDFIISSNVSCGTPMPFYLAGRQLNYPEGPLSIGVTGVSGVTGVRATVWSKSRGYLPGNSPNHAPPTTNFAQKIFYAPGYYSNATGGPVDVTTLFPKLSFPHGRSGYYLWQMTRQLPSLIWPFPESIYTTQVPDAGYLFYPTQTETPQDGGL